MPALRIGIPDFCILVNGIILIVFWINDDGQQDQIVAQSLREALLKLPQVIGQAKAVSRIGTAYVSEAESDDLTIELRESHFFADLVGQRKVGHRLLQIQNIGCRSRVD